MKKTENYINHIALVLDASGSMYPYSEDVIKVADKQIAYLAKRSKELDQETRVTVYTFNNYDNIRCLIYDKDVLRVPSIKGLYEPNFQTALVDATLLALNDLDLTPEKYGEHAFLIYVLTDGQENNSLSSFSNLHSKISSLPDNWTLATFVPDQQGVFEAKKFGFPKENIAVWNTSKEGLNEAAEKIKVATDNFMQNRRLGIRSSTNLFTLDTPDLSTIVSRLDYLTPRHFSLVDVEYNVRIDELVEDYFNRPYVRGEAYYQLTKPETIQPQKRIAIYAKNRVFTGSKARELLGLPDYSVKVTPSNYAKYDIFVQSTSVNRKLIEGTKLLVIHDQS